MPEKTENIECTVEEMFIGLNILASIANGGIAHDGVNLQVQKLKKLFIARYKPRHLDREQLNEVLPEEIAEAYRPLAIALGQHLYAMNLFGLPILTEDQKRFFCRYRNAIGEVNIVVKPFYSPEGVTLDILL